MKNCGDFFKSHTTAERILPNPKMRFTDLRWAYGQKKLDIALQNNVIARSGATSNLFYSENDCLLLSQ
jgi:hypothetical protein